MLQAVVIEWIKQHAPLELLCKNGGWPDPSSLNIDIRSQIEKEWVIDIEFIETIMEISECDIREDKRCGEFAVAFDATGQPTDIRIIQRLWTEGDVLL